jgi:hypothetical protein
LERRISTVVDDKHWRLPALTLTVTLFSGSVKLPLLLTTLPTCNNNQLVTFHKGHTTALVGYIPMRFALTEKIKNVQ